MAAWMLTWAAAYFAFQEPVAKLCQNLPDDNPLCFHLQSIAQFVRACAWSHVFMALFAVGMIAGMMWPWSANYAAMFCGILTAQFAVGGIISIRNVRNFRKAVGLSGMSMRAIAKGAF